MGDILRYQGEHEKAIPWFLESLRIAREINDKFFIFHNLRELGFEYLLLGDLSSAQKQFVEALRLSEILGARGYIAPFLSAHAARALIFLDVDKRVSIPMLLAALPESSPIGGEPSNIMDPIRNVTASGPETIIRSLTFLGAAEEAHDALLPLFGDSETTPGVLSALTHHSSLYPSQEVPINPPE